MTYPAEWQPEIDIISDYLIDRQPLSRADAIFVFGHYLPDLPKSAAELYHSGMAPVILVSGYWHDRVPSGYASEADFIAQSLIKMGVPESSVIVEDRASNTLENVKFGMTKLAAKERSINSLIIVAVPWHMRRARATMIKHYPELVIGTATFDPKNVTLTPQIIARLVGEIDRLVEYHEKGDIFCPEMPNKVRQAAKSLRTLINDWELQSKG